MLRSARSLLALTSLLVSAGLGHAQDYLDQTLLGDLKLGLICPSGEAEKVPAPDTLLGHIKKREPWQNIVYQTRKIPLSKNVGFGFDVKPTGPRALDDVTIRLIHPPYLNADVTAESWTGDIKPGRSNLNFFVFEFRYEMVPGEWTFVVEHGAREILRQSFEVLPVSEYEGIEALCDGALLARAAPQELTSKLY